ncbi:MAG: oligosaccharide flippase family protein [Kiloniellaceae bacterium]
MSIRTSIAWTFSEQTLQQVLQLAGAVVIARLLTPDELGVFALAVSAAAVLTALRTFGVGNYLIREPGLNPEKIRSAFGVMLVISWSLGLVLLLGRPFIAELYNRPGIAEVMGLLALNFVVAPFGAPASALLARDMRFRILHNIGLVSAAAGTGISVTLAFAGFSYLALAWGLLATTCLNTILTLLATPQHAFLKPSFIYWREITKFGGLLSLTSLIGALNAEGVRFILGWFAAPASLAQFNRAAQVPNVFRQGIFQPIARVLTPAWSSDLREGRSIGPGAEKLVAVNTVLVWPVFLALSFVALPFITLVFGENWRPAGEIFPWVLLSQGIVAALPQPEQVLVPHGRVGRIFTVRGLAAVFSIATAIYGASIGLEAFAISRVAAACFFIAVTFLAIRRLIDFQVGRYGLRYLRSAAVAMTASMPAAAFHFSGRASMNLLELLLVVVACGLLWLLAIAVTRHFVWGELQMAARRAFGS